MLVVSQGDFSGLAIHVEKIRERGPNDVGFARSLNLNDAALGQREFPDSLAFSGG
jgi:hypothetical protein